MQSEMDFGIFATAQCNYARRKNAPPQPDAAGLFDFDGVAVICGRRQCHAKPNGELFVDVRFKEKVVRATAIAPCRWDAVAILSACTRAHGNRVYTVDYEGVTPRNCWGLDELRIAAIVGADGMRPYLSRRGRHETLKRDGWARAYRGEPTWAFRKLFDGYRLDGTHRCISDYNLRHALRALEDAGLVHIELGPRGGMATAKVEWLPQAYLAAGTLAPADDEALGELA